MIIAPYLFFELGVRGYRMGAIQCGGKSKLCIKISREGQEFVS